MLSSTAALADLQLDSSLALPLHQQLYEYLRGAILAGRLPAGVRLPATRALSSELQIARNTVLDAYAQLLAEGYVEGKVGAGTFVSRALPDDLLHVQAAPPAAAAAQSDRRLSQRGQLLSATPVSLARQGAAIVPFKPGLPTLDTFPFDVWSRMLQRHWRRPPPALLSYGDPAGYWPLRQAIAAYLLASRGVRCSAEQVIVVSGSQHGLDLVARVLLDPGDAVWVEDPGYLGARGALMGSGARLVPVPVDSEGLSVAAGVAACPSARLAYVTPSHQYPLGVTMSLPRRLALLEWLQRSGAWLVEDDYDSEYRYAGRPLPALQGLDRHDRTIYLGTFSKVLFPALRLGYLVAPADLVDTFSAARALVDRHGATVEQAALADFMDAGHFLRHIRRTRALYAARQAALLDSAQRYLAGLLEIGPAEAGMHLLGWLPAGSDDRAASQHAQRYGIDAPALSAYALGAHTRSGLMLGYAAFSEAQILNGVRQLARALGA